MVSDLTNPLIKRPNTEATSVSRQNQLPVSQKQQVGQKFQSNNSATDFKFPNNDEIAERVELALEQQSKGAIVRPGAIVNILV